MKNIRIIFIRMAAAALAVTVLLSGCVSKSDKVTTSETSVPETVIETEKEDKTETSSSKGEAPNKDTSSKKPDKNNSSEEENFLDPTGGESFANRSEAPEVTVATQVANNICVIGGFCPKDTEYITVSGINVSKTKIVPYVAESGSYFLGQVKYTTDTELKITAKQKGKNDSDPEKRSILHKRMTENYMTKGEYTPYIGKDSRMHFYTALLSYTLPSSKLTSAIRTEAKKNISDIVSKANDYGAEPIFMIIPSSAEIYPETLPEGYNKRAGETITQAFTKIATECGAKVIYPLETMKKHKNDGVGYQLYQNTDSHWSTYGAYWGTYDLLQYISGKFPNAKPRTLKEMQFYTTEMYGGDALFNFPKNIGFENSVAGGYASETKIRELTTLYRLSTPSYTILSAYNGGNGLYLTWSNSDFRTEGNKKDKGLPTAMIMRDSFGKVAFDILNDRFGTVYWGQFDNYNMPHHLVGAEKPDYLIYLYSERSLIKIMLNNSNVSLLTLK